MAHASALIDDGRNLLRSPTFGEAICIRSSRSKVIASSCAEGQPPLRWSLKVFAPRATPTLIPRIVDRLPSEPSSHRTAVATMPAFSPHTPTRPAETRGSAGSPRRLSAGGESGSGSETGWCSRPNGSRENRLSKLRRRRGRHRGQRVWPRERRGKGDRGAEGSVEREQAEVGCDAFGRGLFPRGFARDYLPVYRVQDRLRQKWRFVKLFSTGGHIFCTREVIC